VLPLHIAIALKQQVQATVRTVPYPWPDERKLLCLQK